MKMQGYGTRVSRVKFLPHLIIWLPFPAPNSPREIYSLSFILVRDAEPRFHSPHSPTSRRFAHRNAAFLRVRFPGVVRGDPHVTRPDPDVSMHVPPWTKRTLSPPLTVVLLATSPAYFRGFTLIALKEGREGTTDDDYTGQFQVRTSRCGEGAGRISAYSMCCLSGEVCKRRTHLHAAMHMGVD